MNVMKDTNLQRTSVHDSNSVTEGIRFFHEMSCQDDDFVFFGTLQYVPYLSSRQTEKNFSKCSEQMIRERTCPLLMSVHPETPLCIV
jgi:hypothetical protein